MSAILDQVTVGLLGGIDINGALLRWAFGRTPRMHLYSQLASFTSQGLPPYRTLERVNRIARKRLAADPGIAGLGTRLANVLSGKRRALAARTRVIDAVLAGMDAGKGLADAMKRWVPVEESEMLRTGERADRLEITLRELEHLLKVKVEIASSLLKSAAGAGARFAILIGMMFYILNTVLKEARTLISPEMFDALTLAPLYFRFGEFFLDHFFTGAIAVAVLCLAIVWSLPRWRPFGLRQRLDTLAPPWSLYAHVQSATLLTSASAMMESGRQFREALVGLSQNGTPWLRTHCRRMLQRLEQGRPDAEALQTGMLPWELEDRLGVYAMLDDFKKVMRAVARDSLEIVLRNVAVVGKLMSVVAMLSLGAFILFTVFSIGEIALEAQSAIGSAVPKS